MSDVEDRLRQFHEADIVDRLEIMADTEYCGEEYRAAAAQIRMLREQILGYRDDIEKEVSANQVTINTLFERDAEVKKLRELLRNCRPFVAFNAVELRELRKQRLSSEADEQVKRRIADVEKLVADIDEAIGGENERPSL